MKNKDSIFIRPLARADLMFMYTLYSDTEACRASGARPVDSIIGAQQYLEKHIQLGNCFVIVLKNTSQPVGLIYCTHDIHRYNKTAYMLSYKLHRDFWGQGIMPLAVERMLKYLFTVHNATVVTAAHFTDNIRSKRVLEKCGFRYEGTLRKEFRHWDGSVRDSCMYSILREEYMETHADK